MSQCHGHCNASCHLSHTGHYTLHYNTASINHYTPMAETQCYNEPLRNATWIQVTWSPGHLVTWGDDGTDGTQCSAFANCDARVVCSCQYVTSWWVDDGLMETSAPGNNIVMRGRDTSQDWARGCSDHQGVISQTGITTSWSADNSPDTEQIQDREILFINIIFLRSVCICICI